MPPELIGGILAVVLTWTVVVMVLHHTDGGVECTMPAWPDGSDAWSVAFSP